MRRGTIERVKDATALGFGIAILGFFAVVVISAGVHFLAPPTASSDPCAVAEDLRWAATFVPDHANDYYEAANVASARCAQ